MTQKMINNHVDVIFGLCHTKLPRQVAVWVWLRAAGARVRHLRMRYFQRALALCPLVSYLAAIPNAD